MSYCNLHCGIQQCMLLSCIVLRINDNFHSRQAQPSKYDCKWNVTGAYQIPDQHFILESVFDLLDERHTGMKTLKHMTNENRQIAKYLTPSS